MGQFRLCIGHGIDHFDYESLHIDTQVLDYCKGMRYISSIQRATECPK
jgi:hypothetical protein